MATTGFACAVTKTVRPSLWPALVTSAVRIPSTRKAVEITRTQQVVIFAATRARRQRRIAGGTPVRCVIGEGGCAWPPAEREAARVGRELSGASGPWIA